MFQNHNLFPRTYVRGYSLTLRLEGDGANAGHRGGRRFSALPHVLGSLPIPSPVTAIAVEERERDREGNDDEETGNDARDYCDVFQRVSAG